MQGHVHVLQAIAQVRLVCSVALHGLVPRHAAQGQLQLHANDLHAGTGTAATAEAMALTCTRCAPNQDGDGATQACAPP